MTPLTVTEKRLCYSVAYLKQESQRCQTAKSYLSAVRYVQISHGLGDLKMGEMPQLELVMRGMKERTSWSADKEEAFNHPKNPVACTSAMERKRHKIN